MHAGFAQDQHAFRQAIRGLLRTDEMRTAIALATPRNGYEPDAGPLYRRLGELGILAVHWPAEHGGAGRPLADAAIVAEELVRAGVPDTLHVNTIQIVGQFLLMAGTDAQKRRFLPALAKGERFASVLYTEPDAGSDLGALATTAIADGDGYRLTGTKVFSLKTRFVDYGLCAARTTPGVGKYKGISLFMVDMRAPGVTVETIAGLADEQYHHVELRDVRVAADDLMGPRDQGWPLLNEALAIERHGLDYHLKAERWLAAATDSLCEPDGQTRQEAWLEQIGRFSGALAANHGLCWDVLAGIARDDVDPVAAAIAKYHSSELAESIAQWAIDIPSAHHRADARPAAVILEAAYREGPGLTLSAGTSEMMLQIICADLETDGRERL